MFPNFCQILYTYLTWLLATSRKLLLMYIITLKNRVFVTSCIKKKLLLNDKPGCAPPRPHCHLPLLSHLPQMGGEGKICSVNDHHLPDWITSKRELPKVGVLTVLSLSNTSWVKYFFNRDLLSEACSFLKPASNFSNVAASTIFGLQKIKL